MPLYEFRCKVCGKRTEVLRKVGDFTPPPCSACGGETEKQMSAGSFEFKGSGFYATDYKQYNDMKGAAGKEPENG